jgi:hypothetical protein
MYVPEGNVACGARVRSSPEARAPCAREGGVERKGKVGGRCVSYIVSLVPSASISTSRETIRYGDAYV